MKLITLHSPTLIFTVHEEYLVDGEDPEVGGNLQQLRKEQDAD